MSVMAAVDMADEVVYLRSRFDALLSLCSKADEDRRYYGRDYGKITTEQVREILDGKHEDAPAVKRKERDVAHLALLALVTDHHPDCSPPCMCERLQRLLDARAALEKVVG